MMESMSFNELRGAVATPSPGEETYASIRRSILEGALRPGERIVEQQLAEMLNVSRTPVREALLKLERENLVARMGRGMAVRTYSSDEVRDIYDLRAHLEGYAARVACERVSEAEITALERVQDDLERDRSSMAEADRARTLAQTNQKFHAVLIRSARSAPLERCFIQVVQLPLLYKAYLWYDDASKLRSARDHRDLINLLRARDGDTAEHQWRRHILLGRDVLVEHLAAHEAGEA
jgi:DNA-binding GntR family transcriptional regulator